MRFGYFDDRNREYVIERPDTPWPWINYLGDGEYCGIISNNAGGYSFHKSAGENRILRYRFNAVPCDRPGRYIYLRDAEDGEFWTNSWSPTQKPMTKHRTVCRHGLGYTRIESRYKGIASSALYFVPLDDPLEIWSFRLTNRSKRQRTLDVFTYAEFGFPYFMAESSLQSILYVATTFLHDGIIGYRTPVMGWRTRHAFFASTSPAESFDCQREAFIGPWRGEDKPLAVERGRCFGSHGSGGNAVGCMQLRFTLAPGETASTAFLLGEGRAEEEGVQARQIYTRERIAADFAALRGHWQQRLAHLQVKTPDAGLNSMVNVWNAYQAHVTFHWSRSATLIEAGLRDGLGYRDTLQDTLATVHTVAGQVRERILDLLKGQEQRGCALHKVQPLTLETGKGQTIPDDQIWSDDHLWISLALNAYVRETGDLDFLNRQVPWLDAGNATVYEHALRSLEYGYANRGEHGLLLCLVADWNDALQLGRDGQSVWVSMHFCKACTDFAELADALGRVEDARRVRGWRQETAGTINRHGWDGAWYLQARMNDGRTIGAKTDTVASLWLNPQSWAVIAGVADAQRGRQAMDAVHEQLATEYGIHLFAPPHQGYDRDVPGRVCYPPGFKENAGIFCHPNPWAMIAEAMLGRGDRAFEYYLALLPLTRNDQAEQRRIEPYVYGQFVTGKWDRDFGVAHNPWLTGTASWCYVAATQYILGIQAQLHGLRIAPCIPSSWDGFSVSRIFRGATFRITVRNPQHVCHGVKQLKVNGKTLDGNVVPLAAAGQAVRVKAIMG